VLARQWQARLQALAGGPARTLARRKGTSAILMYHRVLPDDADAAAIEPGMYVRASTFDRHIGWLKERWQLRTLGEVLRAAPAADDPPLVALTFDDGWRDNLTVAWPILRKHGVGATIFLVRDFSLAGANALGEFVRPAEIRDLAAGGIELGAHTVTHPDLTTLDAAAVEDELRRSKEQVEDWTGKPCDLFAYPFGRQTAATHAIARRHFRASVLARGGWWTPGCDVAQIPRVAIHEDMTSTRALFERRLAA
jgi:peptidoglycan/xylan/chitin deacetylase (PgdA/CDA1 family)